MSYDAGLKIFTGKALADLNYDWNMTCNVGKMYRKALHDAHINDDDDGIYYLDGQEASDVSCILTDMIEEMESHPNEYKALNPSNGWGNYEGALQWLKDIKKACEEHPKATFYIH